MVAPCATLYVNQQSTSGWTLSNRQLHNVESRGKRVFALPLIITQALKLLTSC